MRISICACTMREREKTEERRRKNMVEWAEREMKEKRREKREERREILGINPE